MTVTFSPPEFEQHLQNCLTHFYDYAYLHSNEFVGYLVPDEDVANRIQKFRKYITQSIEKMQPPDSLSPLARGARSYTILTLRYIEQEKIEDIIAHLAISRRQYYREHDRAITTLAIILQEGSTIIHDTEEDIFTIQSEIARLSQYSNDQELINPNELFAGILEMTSMLARKKGITLYGNFGEENISVPFDRALLRQLMLILVSNIIDLYDNESSLMVSCAVETDVLTIIIRIDTTTPDESAIFDTISRKPSIQTLLQVFAGNLSLVEDIQHCIQLTIPLRRISILIIDDNPDVIALFQRLLEGSTYRLITASDGIELMNTVKNQKIDIIILDIMLPSMDGFEILQTLKSNPDTKNLPILVCSVLDSKALALSLGADIVLSKPPSKTELHQALSKWT